MAGMKSVFWVGCSPDCESPEADAEWIDEAWPTLACPACSTLWQREIPVPLRVVLADDTKVARLGPTVGTPWPFYTSGIELTLAEHLELRGEMYAFGDFVLKGATVPTHRTLAFSSRLQVPQYVDGGGRYHQCAVCHRRFGPGRFRGTWMRQEDIGSLSAFTTYGGGSLIVTDELWHQKRLAQWPNIQFMEIEVRTGVRAPEIVWEVEDTASVQRRIDAWRRGQR